MNNLEDYKKSISTPINEISGNKCKAFLVILRWSIILFTIFEPKFIMNG